MTTTNPLSPTDYVTVQHRMTQVLAGLSELDFEESVPALMRAARDLFPALGVAGNPVSARLDSWSAAELKALIEQYACFSNAAIHMFLEARIRNRWSALGLEIERNMSEEFGAECAGVPHLELMRHGYREELGVETDGVVPWAVTADFLDHMTALFKTADNALLGGVVLAFEATAVEEFRAVAMMLRRYAALTGSSIGRDSLTGEYIAGHVLSADSEAQLDPEMEHYLGMVRAVGSSVSDQDVPLVGDGFLSACLELNRWWEQLAGEMVQRSIRQLLSNAQPHGDRVYSDLRARLVPAEAGSR